MDLSYWEKNWFTNVDYTIVGSGIVGLHAGLRLREKFPDSKILVLEKGFSTGASTRMQVLFVCLGDYDDLRTQRKKLFN
jgi:glycine/D-amino acid oxidase-like deaminating enzyme